MTHSLLDCGEKAREIKSMTNSELAQYLEECADRILDLILAESFGGWRQRRDMALKCAQRMKQEALQLRIADNEMEFEVNLSTGIPEEHDLTSSSSETHS